MGAQRAGNDAGGWWEHERIAVGPSDECLAVRASARSERVGTMLTPEDKLAALRAGDAYRKWTSLDDRRFCLLCERTFTGRQVEIMRKRNARVSLRCPSENCPSSPREWVFPGNPLISENCWQDWQRAFDEEE